MPSSSLLDSRPEFKQLLYPYGIVSSKPLTRRDVEFNAFLNDLEKPRGLGKFEHLRGALLSSYPTFTTAREDGTRALSDKWNPWLERCLRAFTNSEYASKSGRNVFRSIVLSGAGAAGKTECAGLYALTWWGCSPHNSIAILTSTTKEMIRHRIWPVVQRYYSGAQCVETGERLEFGHLIDSQTMIQAVKGDCKHAIYSLAVAHGETQKALQNLKGQHAERMLLVIDEANGTPQAIFEAIPNMRKGCRDFTLIIIGNPTTRLDAHGQAAEPIEGWGTIGVESEEWRTKAIPEWQVESGVCLHFDGAKSPNVVAGRNLYPYIYTLEDWKKAQAAEGTFAYWSQDRGFWPPEGFQNTVFNEQLVTRCDAFGHYTFATTRHRLAFLDPAFGGDACVLQFAELGDTFSGRMVLQLTDWLEVPIESTADAADVDYQIARRVMHECKQRGVLPYCFGLDATGIGRGVGAMLASEWSPQIHYMQWSSASTDRASAQNDGRPGNEVYTSFVTEMWFAARELLESQQIKGFSKEAVNEFCARQFTMAGRRYKIEPKEDMKARMRYSPDHADAVVGVVEVARRNGLDISGRVAQVADTHWQEQVTKAQEDSPLEAIAVHDSDGWGEASIW